MKDSWLCKDYKSGNEYQILSLYRQATGREMSLDFWKWKFEQAPFGRGVIKLMFDGNKLIGHYSVIPMDTEIQSLPVRAVFSLNTMTHPEYQGQGIFTYLARETYKACSQLGFKFVYGFPNELFYPISTKKLGWKGLGKMSILCENLREKSAYSLPSKRGFQIYQEEEFGDDIDLLWHKVKGQYKVVVPRTKNFLNWRYVEHPGVNYVKYISRDNNGQAVGFVVLKVFRARNETRGHIVDILSLNDSEAIKGLIRRAFDYFIEKGIDNVSCWMQDNHLYADVLKEAGFVRKRVAVEHYPRFGVLAFDDVMASIRSIQDIANWYLTMGDDCDVF